MAILKNRIKTESYLLRIQQLLLPVIKRSGIILSIFVAVFLLFSNASNTGRIVSEYVTPVISKLDDIFFSISNIHTEFIERFRLHQNIQSENKALKLQNQSLIYENQQLKALETENIALKKLLYFHSHNHYTYITARIFAMSNNPFSNVAIIEAGSLEGIKMNQIVVSESGLIGRIVEVSEHYSKVITPTDPNSRIPVITSISHTKAVLTGDNGILQLVYLDPHHQIQQDEAVLTSGDGEIYPAGIKIANIVSVTEDGIKLQPAAELQFTKFVSIIQE